MWALNKDAHRLRTELTNTVAERGVAAFAPHVVRPVRLLDVRTALRQRLPARTKRPVLVPAGRVHERRQIQFSHEDLLYAAEERAPVLHEGIHVAAGSSQTVRGIDHTLADHLAVPAFDPASLRRALVRGSAVRGVWKSHLLDYTLGLEDGRKGHLSYGPMFSRRVPGTSRVRTSDRSVAQRHTARSYRS